jgi:ribosomal protein S18 acetylase RimI-like enzyme
MEMPEEEIIIEAYADTHAKSIAEHLFVGVPEQVIRDQREELLNPGPDEVFSVCAISKGNVVGVCTGVRMKWVGARHRIEMVQVVVREGFRGRGVAREMMRAIAKHFSTRGVEIIQISAEASNADALRAYEGIGFQKFGVLRDGIKHDDQCNDEIMMAAPIVTIL